ncbi:hypothetical protein [Streptomyces sp. NPDC048442]|uniref:hypothetical protein n=1 Tax=Streptomyces sp. NPDC048442 TaxID=3154823 RepID=UPI003424A483
MMRRLATVLGACATAATLALTAATSAYAAHGSLVINGVAHQEPSGCFPLSDFGTSTVSNQTDQVVVVWSGPGCTGGVDQLLNPGVTFILTGSKSVFI